MCRAFFICAGFGMLSCFALFFDAIIIHWFLDPCVRQMKTYCTYRLPAYSLYSGQICQDISVVWSDPWLKGFNVLPCHKTRQQKSSPKVPFSMIGELKKNGVWRLKVVSATGQEHPVLSLSAFSSRLYILLLKIISVRFSFCCWAARRISCMLHNTDLSRKGFRTGSAAA